MQSFDLLDEELDQWAAAGRAISLWWRDDDAAAATPQLARLVGAARRHRLPIAIAAVPAAMQADLVGALAAPGITVLQHGYAHTNHAGPGRRAVECGGERPLEAVLAELGDGMRILMRTFGASFLPFLVPPWNRIDPAVAAALPQQGYLGLSGFGPRPYQGLGGEGSTEDAPLVLPPRLTAINAHLDLAANFLRHFARLSQTDFLATAKAEVAAHAVALDPAHPAAGASRPFEAHVAVTETHAPLFFPGLRAPVRSAFHPSDHKICSHIGKNVGLDHVGRTGIRIASQTRSEAGVSETVRERVGLKPGGQGGIRTHGELAPTAVFKTAALNHSTTRPEGRPIAGVAAGFQRLMRGPGRGRTPAPA